MKTQSLAGSSGNICGVMVLIRHCLDLLAGQNGLHAKKVHPEYECRGLGQIETYWRLCFRRYGLLGLSSRRPKREFAAGKTEPLSRRIHALDIAAE